MTQWCPVLRNIRSVCGVVCFDLECHVTPLCLRFIEILNAYFHRLIFTWSLCFVPAPLARDPLTPRQTLPLQSPSE